MTLISVCFALLACGSSSGDSSGVSDSDSGTDDGSTDPDAARGRTDGGSTDGGSSDAGKLSDGGVTPPSAFQWHVGGLTAGQQYQSLVAGANKVFALEYSAAVKALAFDASGKTLYSTDVSTPLESTVATPVLDAQLALETDETLLVTVSEDQMGRGSIIKLASDGSIAWHAQPTLSYAGDGPQPVPISQPAIASDGTIYVVASATNVGSGDPLPQLISFSPSGVVNFAINIATDAQRESGVPPIAGAPWITPDGKIGVLVSGASQTIELVTLGSTPSITSSVVLAGTLEVNDTLTPLADGTWLANVSDPSRSVAACSGADPLDQSEIAHYGTDGSLLWHTDIKADQTSTQPVTGAGSDVLIAWGNCADGTGAGLYSLSSSSGTITQTFGNTLGDGLQVLGGSTAAYLLVQNDIVSGVETGPVIETVNRTTGVADSIIGLPCAAAGHASDEYAEMTLLAGNTLIVSCGETPEIPGGGGIYALKSSVAATSGSVWPFANGNAASSRNEGP